MRTFVFVVANYRYAVDAAWVQAVHPLVRARPVPGAPPWITGVIDVHGEFVPLVDAATLLAGVEGVERTLGARILLIDTGFGEGTRARFAMAVDRI
jgi:chemotaxis-related protein WspB